MHPTTALVSIAVTTYNSAMYVVETLESIKNQTYKNIELIISDDFSSDGTVEICGQWLKQNADRFARTELITVKRNTGVGANCNRCIAASRGDWIKFIAGDDILLPNCISDNIAFVHKQSDFKVLFSYVDVFKGDFRSENFLKRIPGSFPFNIMDPAFDAAHQHKLLLLSDRISFTPSYFFHKKTIISVGTYDEAFRLVEDYPMWLKLTKAGVKLHFMDAVTVGYRKHANAINNRIDSQLFSRSFLLSEAVRRKAVYPELPWDLAGRERFSNSLALLFDRLGLNRDTKLHKALYRAVAVYLNPFQYVVFLRKRLLPSLQENVLYA